MFRVGGDEFVLVTGLTDIAKAEEIRQSILAKNGNPVVFEGKEYPISLYCGITQIPDHLRYSEFYSEVYGAIMQDRKRVYGEWVIAKNQQSMMGVKFWDFSMGAENAAAEKSVAAFIISQEMKQHW